MKSKIYALLRRVLSQETRNGIKQTLRKTKKKMAPIRRAYHGPFSAQDLVDHLDSQLPDSTEVIMLHSSMHDLYPMYSGSPQELADALADYAIKTNRTLCMPAFIFGGKAYDATQLYTENPIFDVIQAKSETGFMTEYFRNKQGVNRSLHPTHSICAIGPLAEKLNEAHHTCGSIFGADSPFMRMNDYQTEIIGLGCQYFRVLTQVHTVENVLGEKFPYPLDYDHVPMKIVDAKAQEHDFTLIRANNNDLRRVERIEAYLQPNELREWHWHGVPFFCIGAKAVTEALLKAADKGVTIYEKRG